MGWELVVAALIISLTGLMGWAFYVEKKYPDKAEQSLTEAQILRMSQRFNEVRWERDAHQAVLEEISVMRLCDDPRCTIDVPMCAPMIAKGALQTHARRRQERNA